MRLYHQPRSRSTRVLWLAEEAGAPVDVVVIAREEKLTDDYRKMHPMGRSPAYVEDGGPVFESAALVLHLADRHPEAGLIAPLGSYERALQYQWSFFAMTELEAPLLDVARQVWKDSGEPSAEIVEAAIGRFERGVAVVEAALAGGDHLVGDSFSVADIVVCGVLSFARTSELTELPAGIVPYVDGLEARPARQRAYTRTA
ncbi:MAG TPA: glutathione S-transferase family protein [Gaiellales bacterium]|jgi:glutathione S-transferase|nr:glutathione S-transferase family protein [Gaiellales bacterium]